MGGSGKLMAFAQGQLITASELNNINYPLYAQMVHGGGSTGGWQYWPSTSGIYCRNKTNQLWYRWFNGLFGGGDFQLQKLVSGSWTVQVSRNFGWNSESEGFLGNYGEGWYRLYYEGNAEITFRLHWANYPNTVGSYLRYFNDYNSSGYDTSGTKLTAAILNSGRVGTIL